jgi:hypothetical protein
LEDSQHHVWADNIILSRYAEAGLNKLQSNIPAGTSLVVQVIYHANAALSTAIPFVLAMPPNTSIHVVKPEISSRR